ncbi:MAG: disulfide bond formation protein B [Pseudomonadota bacterium]
MALPTSRLIYLIVFGGCTFLMGVALYMEHAMGLEPCPLCIFQRVFVIVAGTVALVAAVHNPGVTGIRIYGALVGLSAVIGGSIAIRQLWLQSLPEDQVPSCGPDLDYLMDVFPLTEVISMVLSGDGSCAEVQWSLLGLSIPGWTLLGFIGLIAISLLQIIRPTRA